ncbi:sensor/response regulator hybrid [Catenovulum agarivorans DS-2]|uniref:Sensory/regulatory protein RpfC n=1 Tax=Catenovulum agarivorans DS-2 TaxID=1328313 RepID=W7Q7X9_9ALTE|nr:response regulator [Catenovulum agarivorans]EWH08909.1 sensor/response regulator hybrid [Catenovulum agarivorans DS-2]
MLSSDFKKLTSIFGIFTLLLGFIVIIGWYTHNQQLIQVLPHFVPMQYNTALGFLLAGIALTWLAHKKIVQPLAIFLCLIGGATLLEYLLGSDFGIDQLLMEHYVTTETSHPGRMAPNTALCFFLTGLAISLQRTAHRSKIITILASFIISTLIVALGLIALSGYTTGLETTYGWGHYTRMAVHTSIGFIALGVGLMLSIFNQYRADVTTKDWSSAVATVGLVATVIILWQTLVALESKNIKAAIEDNAINVAKSIDTQLELYKLPLHRLAQRIRLLDNIDNNILSKDISNYLKDHPSIVAITLLKGNDIKYFDSLVYQKPNQISDITNHIENKQHHTDKYNGYFSQVTLNKQRQLIHYMIEIKSNSFPANLIAVTLDVQNLFAQTKQQQNELGYKLLINSKEISQAVNLETGSDNRLFVKQWRQVRPLNQLDWQIEVIPKSTLVEQLRTGLTEIVLAFGIVLSIAIVVAIRLWQIAIERAKGLEQQKSKLELAADIVNLGVWQWDIPQNTQEWDEQLCKIYAVPEEVKQSNQFYEFWQSMVHPDDIQQAQQHLDSVLDSDETRWNSEFRLLFPNNTVKHISANGVIIRDNSGRAISMLGTNLDVTAEKEMQANLIALREKADAASQAKSDFLANMSHEIRTPMNGIIGLTQLVLSMPLDEKVKQHLQKVEDSSKALLNILNDILDYSKIEAGKLNVVEEDFDLERLLTTTSGILTVKADDKHNELNFKIEPGISQFYRGDSLRLSQILNNLVGNAIKFTENGSVTITVTQSHKQDSVWLTFSVEDTGIGMSEEQTARLFQPFSQADQSITRRFGGTGLGLTISKRLIDLMGGEITVESEPNKGSIFTFSVPVKKARKPKKLAHKLSEGLKTLVVDDNHDTLDIINGILESWKFHVDVTDDPQVAMDMVISAAQQKSPYDLIIVDWKMPKMDGIKLTSYIQQKLGQLELEQRCTIVMVTAYGKDHVLEQTQRLKVELDAIIEKPVFASHLHDVLVDLQAGTGFGEIKPNNISDSNNWSGIPQLNGKRILLVEDNEINQLVAIELLNKFALQPEVANNGKEAVELFEQSEQNYDLILMDLQMPVMDGYEATKAIREKEKGKHVPIIAMTAAAMVKDVEEVMAAGMDGHISKPIDVKLFIQTLSKFLS